MSECGAKGFPGDDGLLLGQIGKEYIPLVDWFSSDCFGFERSMYIDKRIEL